MFRFAIDRGGTFTDVYAELPDGSSKLLKLLSVDPGSYVDAPTEGIRRILEAFKKSPIPKDKPIPCDDIEWIRMGTTVATNALLERKGAPFVFVTTKGFGDVLHIGDQTRQNIFDLRMRKSTVLSDVVVEVEHRMHVVDPTTGRVEIESPLDEQQVRLALQRARHLHPELQSCAVCLLHAHTRPEHEELVAKIALECGFEHVSLSSRLVPMVRLERRAATTCADAYLTPLIAEYVRQFRGGFEGNLHNTRVQFMMSDGGMCSIERFCGYKAVLSGPAGGVVGYSRGLSPEQLAPEEQPTGPLIGFDMGGTSTDVSRFDGSFAHFYSAVIAGVKIQAPQLDITTVAAGGGSRLFFRSGLLVVGPESAGAHPGPVCYRKQGGQLAVTDANVVLGRIVPQMFPHIFGKDQNLPLDAEASRREMSRLADEVNAFNTQHGIPQRVTAEELAMGFVHVANEAMCRPIRNISEGRGYSASAHSLACFGGAGGQHACAIARSLGISTVYIHRFAGVLSAYGIGMADAVEDVQSPLGLSLSAPGVVEKTRTLFSSLEKSAKERLAQEGHSLTQMTSQTFLNLRFNGTDTALMIDSELQQQEGFEMKSFRDKFLAQYEREFGFLLQGRDLIIDDVRVRVSAKSGTLAPPKAARLPPAQPIMSNKCYFGTWVDTPVYRLSDMGLGFQVNGPALIVDETNTIVIEPYCTASIRSDNTVIIHVGKPASTVPSSSHLDNVLLSVFAHRFMSIAEQMGRTLQRTSVSTNIKERKDFSCALFGPTGGLVANAPHLPVHLGSMQDAIRWQIKHLGDSWKEGSVVCSNHPDAGGTHLPDITVITPVFTPESKGKPVFFVASRGHHADIGGISPGSMPPFSTYLEEEGAAIHSFFLVKDGVFQEAGITEILQAPGKIPMKYSRLVSSGTRDLKNNISDLQAQVAANQKGITLMKSLIQEYSLETVTAYMQHVQDNCELAVRDMLRQVYKERNLTPGQSLHAVDYMDDGSRICLSIAIDPEKGSAVFDFTGTSDQVHGNINAPRSITYSAIIYCLRCLVDRDVPLNQGVMAPIDVIIPRPSILSPSPEAGVVGGNVLTSQRITDVILMAFGAAANSQGDMSNLTFGDESFGYYETICGGAGAGPSWNGESAVQCHMTNTACTDVEILERRYPVVLRRFAVRKDSGGKGSFRGGDGVVREIEFLRDNMSVGILSERRALAPHGLFGGGDGERGRNTVVFKDGRTVSLGPKNEIRVNAGDRIIIETPGGGGFGKK